MFNFKSAFLIAAGLAAVLYVCLSNPSRANEKPSSRSLQTMADNADNQHADDIYIGPEIGSIAKEQWPELVGMGASVAKDSASIKTRSRSNNLNKYCSVVPNQSRRCGRGGAKGPGGKTRPADGARHQGGERL